MPSDIKPKAKFDPVRKLAERKFAEGVYDLSPAQQSEWPDRETGDTEKDDKAELEHIRRELAQADKAVEDVSGCEFYTTIVFLTSEQRNAFLKQFPGIILSEGGRYVDGITFAKELGVDIPPARPTAIRPAKPDKKAVSCGIIGDYPE